MLSNNDLKFLGQMAKLAADAPTTSGLSGFDRSVRAPEDVKSLAAAQVVNDRESGESMDNLKGYGKAVGMGAAGGAIAGIPIAALVHALSAGEGKHSFRDYLKAMLMGGLIGGGAGGLGGAGLRALAQSDPATRDYLQNKIQSAKSINQFTLPTSFARFYPGARNTSNIMGPDYDPLDAKTLAAAEAGEMSVPGFSLEDPMFGGAAPFANDSKGMQNKGLSQLMDAYTGR